VTYYYDANFTPFTVTLAYSNQPDTIEIGQTMARELKNNGVQVTEKVVTSADIQNMIVNGEKNYDLLVTGINL
jgi:MarR-like DNA-binding transcriptional regulator SgrR of sgrS sRNA